MQSGSTGGGPTGQGPEDDGPVVRRPQRPTQPPNYMLRRLFALAVLIGIVAIPVAGFVWLSGRADGSGTKTESATADGKTSTGGSRVGDASDEKGADNSDPGGDEKAATSAPPTSVEVPAPPLEPERAQGAAGPAASTVMVRVQALGGESMAPKSIVASSKGLLFAQNMMYRHSMSVFEPNGALVKTIPDSVDLASFGVEGHPGISKGAPVEMAFSPDGKIAWVSNYSMYGTGFGPEGSDKCSPGDGTDSSFLYRIDTGTLEITDVIPVGAVPKYVAATPDGSKVLVTNWCTWDLSVIDTATKTEIKRVSLNGRYPRGIAVAPDSSSAYIAIMGSDRLVKVDLTDYEVRSLGSPGAGPRHIVISPDGSTLYVTNNRGGNVTRMDAASGKVTGSVSTGAQPRSATISSDGEAVYVVNYVSSTVSKVRTSDMKVMQSEPTDRHPIGITYEPTLQRVWVACYGGRVLVFDDSKL